jgi:Uma2 family endonuclease
MAEYVANGVRLGWLIDPLQRRVEIYRPDITVIVLENPDTISGEPELPGFTLDLTDL